MKRTLMILLVLTFLMVQTVSLFAGGTEEAAEQVTSVNLRTSLNPETLDPTLLFSSNVNIMERMLFVSLVDFDEVNGEPSPDLATSWEASADGKTWTFHLRDDVVWTNGEKLTAKDVQYSIQRILDPAVASPLAGRLYSIENAKEFNTGAAEASELGIKIVDDYTIQFMINDPIAFFPSQIRIVGFPVPQETVETHGDRWFEPENIVSSGPYLLTEWKPNDMLVFEKNPDYYDAENVQIEKVVMYVVEDDSTAMSMFEAGEIDTVDVPSGDIDRVNKDPILSEQVTNVSQLISYMIQVNTEAVPFDNPLVRKAFAAAIDKQSLVKNIAKGGQTPTNTLSPQGVFGSVSPSAGIGIEFDPVQAKEYLAEAGYPNGKGLPEVQFNFNTSEFNRNVAEALQQMWLKNLGVDVAVKNIEGKVYWDIIVAGGLQWWRMGFAAELPDAHSFLYDIAHTTNGEKNLRWHRTDFDALVEAAMIETDLDKRREMYMEAERILCEEEAAVIPLWNYAYVNLTKPFLERQYSKQQIDSVKNWKVTPKE